MRGGAQTPAAPAAGQPGNLQAAEAAAGEQVKTHPTAENWQRLGLIRHLQNKFDTSVPAFREAVRLNPSLWTAHLFLGIGLYRANDFAGALNSLEQAERLNPPAGPGRDDLDYWLAATRIATKQPVRGLQDLERLLKRNPQHAQALELAVQTYTDVGSALWNGVAEKHFETAAGYEIHGHALESEGDLVNALEAFRESQKLAPKRPGPGFEIGRLLLRQGKAEDALAELKAERALPGADPLAGYYAGLACIQLGRYTEAIPFLESAAPWAGQNSEVPLALAQVLLAAGQWQRAGEAARQALGINPESEAAHQLLAAALRQAGETAAADEEERRWMGRRKK